TLDKEALAALETPDLILIKPCGFPLERTRAELGALGRMLPLERWGSVRMFAADGNAYFNRPGPRIVDSLEILAALLYPERFGELGRRYRACYTEHVYGI